ncbi:MAG: hypothetical protein O7E54_11105 [Planctomycetota bacterium]|nr:hypothetical protein [Planctomycetota bacterium]
MDWLGAHYRANRVLREGLERFKDSERLHEKLRERVMRWRGPDGLEAAYKKMFGENARVAPFAGIASVKAAELHRRRRAYEKALAAYGRAIGYYEKCARPDAAIALALAGRARVAYELEDDERALADVLASFGRSPDTAGDRDGMNVTPGETAQMLLARLRKDKKDALAAKLAAALDKIDPDLLAPDVGLR